MIQLLFLVVFAEATISVLLMVKIGPLRELVMNVLDQVKMRKATVLTIAGTICAILFSNSLNIVKIHSKGAKIGTMTPMDQVLWRTQLLETSLMGFSLFLGFVIERMHYHLRKFSKLKSSVGNSKEELDRIEKEKIQLRDIGEKAKEEIKILQKEVSKLTNELNKVKAENAEKEKQVITAESHVASLQKQSADLLLEYDRLLEDNQNLQKQAMAYRR